MVHLHAYVHPDTAARLRRNAREEERSLAGELRRALRWYTEMLDGRPIQAAGVPADGVLGGAVVPPSRGRPAPIEERNPNVG